MSGARLILSTALALSAFAANSLLCRLALGRHAIDAASFTSLRLVSGACMLLLLGRIARREERPKRAGALTASFLFLYAICFSFAYDSLTAGVGALILFGSVQVTMLAAALHAGERLPWLAWVGLLVAALGLVSLVFPGLSAPAPLGAALMALSGVAWGAYTLRGRGSLAPVADTARSFVLASPFALAISAVTASNAHVSQRGIALSLVSGALTSGLGYAVWYSALAGLSTARAAALQLLVPLLAAIGGIVLLAEPLTWRLAGASALILGGVALVVAVRARRASAG